jgi:hypothetical protein
MQVSDVVSQAQVDPAFKAKLEEDPVSVLASMPLQSDVWIYRIVVFALGTLSIMALVGDMALAFYGKQIPEGVIALGSTALGALAGLLVLPTARGNR